MGYFDRRAFLRASAAGAVSLVSFPQQIFAQTACISSGLPPFTPNRLTVDCATRRNFLIWRKNATYMGLAGCVSMTYVKGKYGEFPAGNLFLFPWLNAKGRALGAAKDWQTVMPTSLTRFVTAAPIPNWQMPLDEYFLGYRMQMVSPSASFIGFRVDVPFAVPASRWPWFTNVDKLNDGKGVGIAWTSSNLNGPWFAGNHWIPNNDTCKGNSWRALIIDGVNQASVGLC